MGIELNAPISYDLGSEHHCLIMSEIGGYVVLCVRERDREKYVSGGLDVVSIA